MCVSFFFDYFTGKVRLVRSGEWGRSRLMVASMWQIQMKGKRRRRADGLSQDSGLRTTENQSKNPTTLNSTVFKERQKKREKREASSEGTVNGLVSIFGVLGLKIPANWVTSCLMEPDGLAAARNKTKRI
jgi:hypothetical protein